MVAFLLLLYMGSAPEDRLRAATVILVFFIFPRLFLFDPRPVSLSAPGFITVFLLRSFLFLSSCLIVPWTLLHAHGSEQSRRVTEEIAPLPKIVPA
jgi:hypothetical protein